MATKKYYKTLRSNARNNTHEFLCDEEADLKKLPKEPGSMVLVANTGDVYICNNAGN